MATGESYKSLSFSYRVGASTIAVIVPEVCQAVWEAMRNMYMPMPSNAAEWKEIAENFKLNWQFPNCCGAVDGKHVVIMAPRCSGSLYLNYKSTFSMVLLAVVDANYKFITIDVGSYGKNHDAGVFTQSRFGKALLNGKLNLPPNETLTDASDLGQLPHVFIGDEAFPLLPNMMRPYGGRGITEEQRIFNYRLSRARRIVENAFGILAARWRVFHTKIAVHPKSAKNIILASCVLHNFLQRTSTPAQINNVDQIDVTRCEAFLPFNSRGNRNQEEAAHVREMFQIYFNNQGKVPWQLDYVRRGKFAE